MTPHQRAAYERARVVPDDSFLYAPQGPGLSQGPELKPRNWLADRARERGLYGLADRLNDRSSGAGLAVDAAGGLLNMLVVEPYQSMNRLLERPMVSGDPRNAEDAFNVAGAAMLGGFAAPKPRNTVGTFGGRLAQTADQQALARAEDNQSRGITAYHGSPHDFDRFDMSKIGTGEGAQAYGQGLYFAENEGVAKSYRDTLSKGGATSQLGSKGNMYEVRINADPEDFLDWDKPLSQQGERVLDAVNTFGLRDGAGKEGWQQAVQGVVQNVKWTGQGEPTQGARVLMDKLRDGTNYGIPMEDSISFHVKDMETAARARKDPEKVRIAREAREAMNSIEYAPKRWSEMFREAGIPGIRYLDAGSRSAGEGSRNYVVFDDSLVEIMRKYGLAGLLASGGAVNNLLAGYGYPQPAQPQQQPPPDWTRNIRPGDI